MEHAASVQEGALRFEALALEMEQLKSAVQVVADQPEVGALV